MRPAAGLLMSSERFRLLLLLLLHLLLRLLLRLLLLRVLVATGPTLVVHTRAGTADAMTAFGAGIPTIADALSLVEQAGRDSSPVALRAGAMPCEEKWRRGEDQSAAPLNCKISNVLFPQSRSLQLRLMAIPVQRSGEVRGSEHCTR